jgi:hypothetical protein
LRCPRCPRLRCSEDADTRLYCQVWMTGLGRPPRAGPLLQSKNKLMRSHRTRPPPADTRRACCHVLSSFQRTGLTRPPSAGLSAVFRRTFQTYQPVRFVSSLNFSFSETFEPLAAPSVAISTLRHLKAPSGRRVASHALRGMVPGGSSDLKVGMRAVRFRRGSRSASLARPSPCGEPDEYTALRQRCQQGISKNLQKPRKPFRYRRLRRRNHARRRVRGGSWPPLAGSLGR